MGMCAGKLSEEELRNRQLNKELKVSKEKDAEKIKLLLLGAGESGKSTLFKQMRLLYSEEKDFSSAERESFVMVVYNNIVSNMKTVIHATSLQGHVPIKSSKAREISQKILTWPKNKALNEKEGKKLSTVWRDPGLQQTWEDRGDIQVQDALEYFMRHIERISKSGYLPVNEDILRTRVRTSGVVQENFKVDSTKFEMYDVGGQRNERRKWIHSFEGVTSVMFVAAISEYNQFLYEDTTVNRQDEAVDLFRQQLATKWFLNTPVILFLNKTDLFREKLPKIPFRVDGGPHPRNTAFQGPHCAPGRDYSIDGTDQEFEACALAAINYLQGLYESQSPPQRRKPIYTKPSNSTDTQNVEHIMKACKDIILRGNLEIGGWMAT